MYTPSTTSSIFEFSIKLLGAMRLQNFRINIANTIQIYKASYIYIYRSGGALWHHRQTTGSKLLLYLIDNRRIPVLKPARSTRHTKITVFGKRTNRSLGWPKHRYTPAGLHMFDFKCADTPTHTHKNTLTHSLGMCIPFTTIRRQGALST